MPGLRDLWPQRQAVWSRLNSPVPVGITVRLVFSFGAVAILAAAANLIVEHGVAVIRTSRMDRGLTSPPPAIAYRVPRARGLDVPVPLTQTEQPSILNALDHYYWATDSRASTGVEEAGADLLQATRELERAAVGAGTKGTSARDGHLALLSQLTKRYEAAGTGYIRIADSRRAAVNDYLRSAEAMDRRVTASLDHAWKIFGRVLARQSLLRLHSELDELRRNFARLSAAAGDRATADALTASEAAFAASFERDSTAFSRSEGSDWVQAMHADFVHVVELRRTISVLDDESREASVRFGTARAKLAATARSSAGAAPAAQGLSAAPPAAAGGREAAATLAAPIASPVLDTITTTTTGPAGRDRRIVGWITAAVLAVLFLISVSTVRSILIPVSRMLRATEKIAAGEVEVRVRGGGIKELDLLGASFNRMAAQLECARDMTRDYQRRLEAKVEQRTRELQHLAEHDPLTHLPNRRQLFILLNHALLRAEKNRSHVGVFFIDIDNFKNLNDSMGHAFGDQVLAHIGKRLEETAKNFGFAGRLGGDEFTAVYEDASSVEMLLEAGRRLVDIFEQPINMDGREVIVRASVGASVYPEHASRPEDLLSAADAALFSAKALGRSQLAVFTPELLETANRKFTIEQGLRRAIEEGAFELVYQPEVSLDSLEMVVVESLVRWRLPDGRQAPPSEFLSITEESGLIIEVGNWVLRKAIETASDWHHGEWPNVRIAINVSPRQLLDRRFTDFVLKLLQEYRLPARCIELELTESVLQTGPATIESLRHLRSQNIAIALDDFGTGYSSLASLENLPLSRIKLDRSLIASIDRNPRAAAIASALIGLCGGLDLDITAEGVERPEQFAALSSYRSIHIQGYLISHPIACDEVMLARRMMPERIQDLLLSVPSTRSRPQTKDAPRAMAYASVKS